MTKTPLTILMLALMTIACAGGTSDTPKKPSDMTTAELKEVLDEFNEREVVAESRAEELFGYGSPEEVWWFYGTTCQLMEKHFYVDWRELDDRDMVSAKRQLAKEGVPSLGDDEQAFDAWEAIVRVAETQTERADVCRVHNLAWDDLRLPYETLLRYKLNQGES